MKILPTLVVFLLSALLVIVGCGSEQPAAQPTVPLPAMSEVTEPVAEETAPADEGVMVEITTEGFSPNSLTVTSGTTVKFVNTDSNERQHWPASAMHPTHEVYPGSGINKCSAAKRGEVQIFDSCDPLRLGESFSFTFNEKGEWKYHDHLRPSSTGTIVVE